MRGRFSVMPPPVMWARPFTRSWSSSGRTSDKYDRCGARSASPTVAPNSGTKVSGVQPATSKQILRASEYPLVCRPADGRPINASPGRMPRPSNRCFDLLDDADDEAGDVVFAVGVESRHLRRLAADRERSRSRGRPRATPATTLLRHRRRQPPVREVVEEEQRIGALHEDVVARSG